MDQRIDAVFESGVFRPDVPVNIPNGQRVSLVVELRSDTDELRDVRDLLDTEFMNACRENFHGTPSLSEVRMVLAAVKDSLADIISQERDER